MTDPKPLRVLLVEDHALVRAAVRQALSAASDIEVVGDVASAEEAFDLVSQLLPDVIIIDIDLPGMHGIELVRELAPRFPDLWQVMLTVSRSERDLLDSIRSGARGFLSKDLSPDALVNAIRDIRVGIMPMSRADASLLILRLAAAAPHHRPSGITILPELTGRENEVLALLADGLTDREISVSLVISRRTVESHVRNILEKLAAGNRLQAARIYRLRGSVLRR
ncbi:MAG: response regulator [Candidatus Limnocylindrales bacterium]